MSNLFVRLPLTRRSFLGVSAAGLGAALLGRPGRSPGGESAIDPYGGFMMSIQSYSLRGYDVDAALENTVKLGLKNWESYPQHIPISTVPGVVQEHKDKLNKAGVKLVSYGVVRFEMGETRAREAFDFAKAMGLLSLSANPTKDNATFDMLDKLVDEYQIPIAIHNHGPGDRYDKVADVLEVIQDRHPLIGACVDTGHYLRSQEDPVEAVDRFGKRVFGVHLKDVRTIYSAEEKQRLLTELPKQRAEQLEREGRIFTILGEGELNTVGLLRALRNLNYSGSVSLEYEEHPENPLSDIALSLAAMREAVAYLDDPEQGFVPLWDGRTFDNWRINENQGSWKIVDGEIVCNGPRSHLFYVGPLAPFKNFELKVDVNAAPNSNSGIYFHTKFQDQGWPSAGFETQVNNTYTRDPRKTGSLYQVLDNERQLIPDNTWWTQHIIVKDGHVTVKVDGKTIVDCAVPEKSTSGTPTQPGTFCLQAHDPGSTVHFKNLRVKQLPD